jgi:hypothetical protein
MKISTQRLGAGTFLARVGGELEAQGLTAPEYVAQQVAVSGSINAAARALGCNRGTVRYWLDKAGLKSTTRTTAVIETK